MGEKISPIIRDPWRVVDYASKRGEYKDDNGGLEILTHLLLIDCGLGDSNEPPPQVLKDILIQTLETGTLIEAFWKYPPDRFCEQPSRLIEERFGLDSSGNHEIIFDGPGSYGILAKIIWQLPDLTTQEEIGVLGIGPQFANIASFVEAHGKKQNGYLNFPYLPIQPSLDLPYYEKIRLLIDQRKQMNGHRFIYIDNPNNPTGDFSSLESIRELVEIANQHKDVVIIDEAYGDVVDDNQSAIHLVDQYPNLIVLRGIAKSLGMAGARVGYAIMSKELGELYKSLQLVFGVGGPQQLVLNEVLKPEIIKPHLQQIREKTVLLKRQLINGLTQLGVRVFPTHEAVPILLAQGPVDNFFQRLRRWQIVTERGSDFIKTYPLDDSYVRIKVPGSEEEIIEVLNRVKQALIE